MSAINETSPHRAPSESQPTPEQASLERFVRETAKHEMTVLRDDGLYRHLRFQEPGSSFYWYDLVTWPGRLVVCGDAGDWMFSRLQDMFQFFESGHGEINPHYWGEKLRGAEHGREQARNYSEEAFKARVLEWFRDVAEDLDEAEAAALREALDEEVLNDDDGYLSSEDEARRRLIDFEHQGHQMSDTWEWDLREWDWSYLWCCWAIARGIERYRAAVPVAALDGSDR